MTTFDVEQANELESVYVGGGWDPVADRWAGGHWGRPAHGGLCRSDYQKRQAVIGPHCHWNGAYYMACTLGEHCDTPSCHPATPADLEYTLLREREEHEYNVRWSQEHQSA